MNNIKKKIIGAIIILLPVFTSSCANVVGDAAVTPTERARFQRMYGGSGDDYADFSTATADGGFVMAGSSTSTNIPGITKPGGTGNLDVYIIKLDSAGNIQWQKMFGGSGDDGVSSVTAAADGGYIVTGRSKSTDITGLTNNGNTDVYIIKLDSTGTILWQKMFGGTGNDVSRSVIATPDGGYIAAGFSLSTDISGLTNNGTYDVYLIKLDSSGNILWQKMFGGSDADFVYSTAQTADGGFVVAGYSLSTDISGVTKPGGVGNDDFYIIKLDSAGNILWQNMFGDSGDDYARSVIVTADGGYIVAGYSDSTIAGVPKPGGVGNSDVYIIKLDSAGNIQWQKMLGGSGFDYASAILQTADGGLILTSTSDSTDIPSLTNYGSYDFYIIKLDYVSNVLWQKMFGGSGDDTAVSITVTSDDITIAGQTNSSDIPGTLNSGLYDFYILKTGLNGEFMDW